MVFKIGEPIFGCHPEYPPVIETFAPASSNAARIDSLKSNLAESIEPRIKHLTKILPSSDLTIARLLEVSTRFSMARLILSTALGQAHTDLTILRATLPAITFLAVAGCINISTLGSMIEISFLTSANTWSTHA